MLSKGSFLYLTSQVSSWNFGLLEIYFYLSWLPLVVHPEERDKFKDLEFIHFRCENNRFLI